MKLIYKKHKETFVIPKEIKQRQWGEGPWVNEPDLVEFVCRGFKCEIKRHMTYKEGWPMAPGLGSLCGYIIIPHGHPWHEKDAFGEHFCDVHYGTTYAQKTDSGEWKVGFDCAHSGDLVPQIEANLKEIRGKDPDFMKRFEEIQTIKEKHKNLGFWTDDTYKTIHFCKMECVEMAKQAAAAEKEAKMEKK